MATPHGIKRRRLDDSVSQLRKPFISPLRRPENPKSSTLANGKTTAEQRSSSSALPDASLRIAASPSPPQNSHDADVHTITPVHSSWQPNGRAAIQADYDEDMRVRKAISMLETRLMRVRKALDTLAQAEKISQSAQNDELRDLTAKWRTASQGAAEELFGTVKERVCRMGGVAAWKDCEKRKHARGFPESSPHDPMDDENDEDCEFDSQGEELSESEQEYRKSLKREARREMMDAADTVEPESPSREGQEHVWEDQGGRDDEVSARRWRALAKTRTLISPAKTFTMDMMLRSLNIKLDVIGYDKQSQRWATC